MYGNDYDNRKGLEMKVVDEFIIHSQTIRVEKHDPIYSRFEILDL